MNVSGIGTTGYPAWQGARKTQPNAAGKSFAAQVNNVADTPKVYNIFTDEDMIWTGGNGTGLSYYLKYGLRGESGAGGSGYVDGVAPFTHNGKYYPAETEAGVNEGNGRAFIRYVECA